MKIHSLEHEHTKQAIAERLAAGEKHSYLRDFVYGGIDGAVTTFAIAAGSIGADLSPKIVLVLGFANLAADGFSMAASNFLGTKAETDELSRVREIERRHIEVDPAGEREEVRQIYAAKGFDGPELERVVELVTADTDRWIETMRAEEYGLPRSVRPPLKAATATFAAFVVCGLVPLLPFLFALEHTFFLASILTGIVFLAVGSVKAKWSTTAWWRSGIESLAIGGIAAILAYTVGILFRDVIL
ncbi:MAG: VIT1/CCC1 transporter family protein [Pyrinomonadaceae bacterium]